MLFWFDHFFWSLRVKTIFYQKKLIITAFSQNDQKILCFWLSRWKHVGPAKCRIPVWWARSRNLPERWKNMEELALVCLQLLPMFAHLEIDGISVLQCTWINVLQGKAWWLSWRVLKPKWLHPADWKSCEKNAPFLSCCIVHFGIQQGVVAWAIDCPLPMQLNLIFSNQFWDIKAVPTAEASGLDALPTNDPKDPVCFLKLLFHDIPCFSALDALCQSPTVLALCKSCRRSLKRFLMRFPMVSSSVALFATSCLVTTENQRRCTKLKKFWRKKCTNHIKSHQITSNHAF